MPERSSHQDRANVPRQVAPSRAKTKSHQNAEYHREDLRQSHAYGDHQSPRADGPAPRSYRPGQAPTGVSPPSPQSQTDGDVRLYVHAHQPLYSEYARLPDIGAQKQPSSQHPGAPA